MPIGIALLLLEVLLAVHVVRTGRPLFWLCIILFVPFLGSTVYLLAEVLPDVLGGHHAGKAARGLDRAINPNRDYRALVAAAERCPTADNWRALAGAMEQRADLDGAIASYRRALAPPLHVEPVLLVGLARCLLLRSEPAEALAAIGKLRESDPGLRSNEADMLQARSLDALGHCDDALAAYRALIAACPGEEARARYGRLLHEVGRTEEAIQVFQEILASAS